MSDGGPKLIVGPRGSLPDQCFEFREAISMGFRGSGLYGGKNRNQTPIARRQSDSLKHALRATRDFKRLRFGASTGFFGSSVS
jgi:hypothetical protein